MEFRKALTIASAACMAVALVSCAKAEQLGTNELARPAFEAWVSLHCPTVVDTTAFGVYITEDIPGTGEEYVDGNYVFTQYVCRNMEDGTIAYSSDEATARKLGSYSSTSYYGPIVSLSAEGTMVKGLRELFAGGSLGSMKIGGRRTAVIPGWLVSTDTYDSAQGYIDNVSGANYIYTIEFLGQTDDIVKWQRDSIERYIAARGAVADTTSGSGFYYCSTSGVTIDRRFPSDTTVYINYIGRLLNGRVFDTNIKDTAKVWGIYNASGSYEPVSMKAATDSTAYTMGSSSSSVITGFSLAVYNMHPFESGFAAFTSDYGYGASGSSPAIPAYAPLVFEIEVVAKP